MTRSKTLVLLLASFLGTLLAGLGCLSGARTGRSAPQPQPAGRPEASTPGPQPTPRPNEGGPPVLPGDVPKKEPAYAGDPKRGEELLRKTIEAMGGAAVIDGIKSLEFRGKSVRRDAAGRENELQVTTRIVFPDRYRQDISLPGGSLATILGPDGAFLVPSQGGSIPLPQEQRVEIEMGIMRNPVALLKTRGDKTFAAFGSESGEIDGKPVGLLTVLSGGESTTLSLDPQTGRILRMRYTHRDAQAVEREKIEVIYSDFRRVDGLTYPFAAEGTVEGRASFSNRLESLIVNGPVDPSLFLPPPASEEKR